MKYCLLIVLFALSAAAESTYRFSGLDENLYKSKTVSSDAVQWKQVSPGHGGTSYYLRIHPEDPNTVIESCDMGATYVTTNGSRSYQSANDPDGTYFSIFQLLRGVDFCKCAPTIGYGATQSRGAFKTTDKGLTWLPLMATNLNGYYGRPTTPFSTVAVDPDDPNKVYLGVGWNLNKDERVGTFRWPNGILQSADGGATWTHNSKAFAKDAMLRKMFITSRRSFCGKMLFAATDRGFYLSRDEGASWIQKPDLVTEDMTTSSNIVQSSSDAAVHPRRSGTLPHNGINDMDVYVNEKTKELVIYVTLSSQPMALRDGLAFAGGVYRSKDFGETWEDATGNLILPVARDVDASLYAAVANSHASKLLWRAFRAEPENAHLLSNIGDPKENQVELLKQKWTAYQRSHSAEYKAAMALFSQTRNVLPELKDIRVDPRNANVIYTSIFERCPPYGLWKTVDGGKKWVCTVRGAQAWKDPFWADCRPAEEPIFNVEQAYTGTWVMNWGTQRAPFGLWDVRTFDLCRSKPDVLYFHTHRVTYRSDDGARTWHDATNRKIGEGIAGNGNANMCIADFYFHPTKKDIMLFLTADCGMWRSEDGGDSLISCDGFGSNPSANAAAFDPADPDKLYELLICNEGMNATDCDGIYFLESDNGGKSLKNVTIAADGTVSDLPNRVMKNLSNRAWELFNALLVDPLSPKDQRTFIAASSAVLRSRLVSAGNFTKRGEGILRSVDGGKTWEKSNRGLEKTSLNIVDLVMDQRNSCILYAGLVMQTDSEGAVVTPGGLFISSDGGITWKKNDTLPLINAMQIVLDPKDSDILYVSGGVGTEGRGASAKTWDANGGIYRSADRGKSWVPILKAPSVPTFAVSPWDSKIMYCFLEGFLRDEVQSPGIFRSHDGGNTWQRVNKGLASNSRITRLHFNPHVRGEVWCGTFGTGCYRAMDAQ